MLVMISPAQKNLAASFPPGLNDTVVHQPTDDVDAQRGSQAFEQHRAVPNPSAWQGVAKAHRRPKSVIPAKAGIQEKPIASALLDPRVRGHDIKDNCATPANTGMTAFEHSRGSTSPHARALALAAQRTAGMHRPALASAIYSGTTLKSIVQPAHARLDAFTNEDGLAFCLQGMPAKGGTVVGVGGAMFDVGSRLEAEQIIVVDANPVVAQVIQVFTAILLAVDMKASAQHWPPQRRAEEVLLRIRGERPELATELKALGVSLPHGAEEPQTGTRDLPWLLERIANRFEFSRMDYEGDPIVTPTWCADEGAAQRILHLTQLALDGRIVSVTCDLNEAGWSDDVNALVREMDSQVSVMHLSNVLDYMRLPYPLDQEISQLAGITDGSVITTEDKRGTNLPWGAFDEPRVHRAEEFSERMDRLLKARWEAHAPQHWRMELQRLGLWQDPQPACPNDYATLRHTLGRLERRAFASPKHVEAIITTLLHDLHGTPPTPEAIATLARQSPRSIREIITLVLKGECAELRRC